MKENKDKIKESGQMAEKKEGQINPENLTKEKYPKKPECEM